MTRRRRQFSSEFKEEAVRMVLEGERTVASVALSCRTQAHAWGPHSGTTGENCNPNCNPAGFRHQKGPLPESGRGPLTCGGWEI
ncbi:transposase [Streptosporangium sp. NBC_01756]|uniref:transposase n=1 Tax=Streptosporangium sp. NBC_01756 TaxID=2975950 RepID=UPI003FA3534B